MDNVTCHWVCVKTAGSNLNVSSLPGPSSSDSGREGSVTIAAVSASVLLVIGFIIV